MTSSGQKPDRGLLWAVVMTTALLSGRQSSEGAARDAVRPHAPGGIAVSTNTAGGHEDRSGPQGLYGTWIAKDVDAKLGEVKIKLTFREDGPVKVLAWSDVPFVGQVRDLEAPYEVRGDTITSKAIRGGTTARYAFEGEHLVLQFEGGRVVRFRRQ